MDKEILAAIPMVVLQAQAAEKKLELDRVWDEIRALRRKEFSAYMENWDNAPAFVKGDLLFHRLNNEWLLILKTTYEPKYEQLVVSCIVLSHYLGDSHCTIEPRSINIYEMSSFDYYERPDKFDPHIFHLLTSFGAWKGLNSDA